MLGKGTAVLMRRATEQSFAKARRGNVTHGDARQRLCGVGECIAKARRGDVTHGDARQRQGSAEQGLAKAGLGRAGPSRTKAGGGALPPPF
jgi:hypothetical protein